MLPHCVAGSVRVLVRPDNIKIKNTNRWMAADRMEHKKKNQTKRKYEKREKTTHTHGHMHSRHQKI